ASLGADQLRESDRAAECDGQRDEGDGLPERVTRRGRRAALRLGRRDRAEDGDRAEVVRGEERALGDLPAVGARGREVDLGGVVAGGGGGRAGGRQELVRSGCVWGRGG